MGDIYKSEEYGGGGFNPRQLFIHLSLLPQDVFDINNQLRPATNIVWGLILHEYFHYLQTISSPVFITVFNNWFGYQTDVAKIFSGTTKTSFPLANNKAPEIQCYIQGFQTLSDEIQAVYDIYTPLQKSKLPMTSAWEFFDKSITLANYSRTVPMKYMLVPEGNQLFEVPLIPSAFAEGMSTSIQWYIETDGKWSDSLLDSYPVAAPKIFYSVVTRWVIHHFRETPPFWIVASICDACLCTYDPGHMFSIIADDLIKAPPSLRNTEDILLLRSRLQNLYPIRADLIKTLTRLNDLDGQLSLAGPREAAADMRKVIIRMKSAVTARLFDHNYFIHPANPKDMLSHFVSIFGAPLTGIGQVNAEDQIYSLADDKEFERTTMLLKAIFHIMEDSIKNDRISPCPFYPNQCKSTQGKYCLSNPLWAPISNSAGCVMAYAAFTLCAHKKGLSPFTLQETAYFNWLSRCNPTGDDWTDWFHAEQELSEE
ncbi:MAG: hypothetical protein NTX59_10370 [Elusimicrobia bacterium]|nr:hypothetical protein [Elusimicrobiota bacterium]